MSAVVIERRNDAGVLLRYEVGGRHAFQDQLKFQPSDRLRMALMRAEREVQMLETIAEHLELSVAGVDRIAFALRSINAALTMAREEIAQKVAP
jgi:hypothetical protein